MAQQLGGPLDAVADEVGAGRAAELRLKRPVQAAPADPCLPGRLLHADGAGVVLLQKGRPLPGVNRQRLPAPGRSCLHQKPQGRLEIARHPHGAGVVGPPGLVDVQQGLPQPLSCRRMQHGMGAGEGGLGQQQRRAGPGEPHPVILPGVLPVRLVEDGRLWPGQEGVPGGEDESPALCLIGPPAGDHVVEQVVVPDTGPPAVPRRTLLKA